jgi:hypothetical protein
LAGGGGGSVPRCARIARGFVYLAVVLDWLSRRVLSWRVSITMEAAFCVETLEDTLALCFAPALPGQTLHLINAGKLFRQPRHLSIVSGLPPLGCLDPHALHLQENGALAIRAGGMRPFEALFRVLAILFGRRHDTSPNWSSPSTA